MSWVKEFYVTNASLYGATIDRADWREGEATARALATVLNEHDAFGQVLDVPCGLGRVAIPLAKLGARVTGIDLSPEYIATARKIAERSRVSVKTIFHVGSAKNMNRILKAKQYAPFDAAISIRSILGYGSEREDEMFLRSIRKLVRDDGVLVLTMRRNEENLEKLIAPFFQETDGVIALQNNNYANSRLYTRWRFLRKRKSGYKIAGEFRTSVRLYSTAEMLALLKRTGWKTLEYGDSILQRGKPIGSSVYFLAKTR